ncbi:MAG: MFS transporter [Candidatus Bathyarchaeota archaeon]|jgi:MFS family permease|nr:MFS transporter [Candidatus Bathyarchaeota archaeon]
MMKRIGSGWIPLQFPKSFDKDLRLLVYSMASRRLSMGFLQVVRAIYFAILGFSPVQIGFLLSIATFVSALHYIVIGHLSDRFSRKVFFILGGIFASLRLVIFAISSDFWFLALGQGVGALGEGAGAGQPVVSAYISDKSKVVDRPQIFSTIAVTNALAATAGSMLAGLPVFFQKIWGVDIIKAHALLFWIGAFGSLLSIIFVLPLKDSRTKKEVVETGRKFLNVSDWRVIVRFSIVRITSGLGWGFIDSLLPLYFYIKFGVTGEVLGPIFAATRFLSVFSFGLIPEVVDRFGKIQSLVGSRIITGILAVAFSVTPWFPIAVVLMISLRIAIMFTMPIRQTFATTLVPPDEIATAIGVSSFARMTMRSVAPTIAGYMFEAISLSLPFMIGAGFLVANGLLYKVFFQKSDLIKENN